MAREIGKFEGPLGPERYWSLPNRGYEWDEGFSLGPYSSGPAHERTWEGDHVHRYKYRTLKNAEREQIVDELSNRLLRVLWSVFRDKHPFAVCLAVPGNRGGPSLPHEVCRTLSARYDWLTDCSSAIVKTRELGTVKPVSKRERSKYLSGAWQIDTQRLPLALAREGILVVDDVYDTGATMREMSRTLRRAFRREPRQYMVAITHVVTRDWNV